MFGWAIENIFIKNDFKMELKTENKIKMFSGFSISKSENGNGENAVAYR